MAKYNGVSESVEYWVNIELEEGDHEKIQNSPKAVHLDIEMLTFNEISSVTFECESSAEEFIQIVKEILGDE